MAQEPSITPELIARHGITTDEFQLIREILGRDPSFTELGIFSVMWSEHCSYKNSKPELKKFPTTGEGVLVRAGEENSGVLDIGDGWAIAFKIESHNHPSAVEPFQGAATGVGGIIRDIFTMGARPVLVMDSLRFGDIRGESQQAKTNRRLLAGVVSGISHYGNCIGLPTVGGEVGFDPAYDGNPLVNVLCLGVLRHDQIRRGKATGSGNPVFYVGAKTGRDGLAGAAFASRDLTEESKEDRPAVQVGDPFLEKLLCEACLELFKHPEAVVGVQDMGAAGLTCSTCETASRGGTGIEIELDRVPQRETGMTAYEIMLSESQERMLIIAKKGMEQEVLRVFEKWDLDAAEVGEVTEDGLMRVKQGGKVVAEIPARRLADDAPIYVREAKEPAPRPVVDMATVPATADLGAALCQVLAHPTVASKRWVYEQYDHMVRNGATVLPGSDAAVVRIPLFEPDEPLPKGKIPHFKHLALSTDCNGYHCWLDPYTGGKLAVAEAARNLACSGARPIGSTDNLNFGNPHIPENFWQLRRAVDGVAEACRAFDAPVTGGNVSLYNQSPLGAIYPTPTIALVGLIDSPEHITVQWFQRPGDAVLLVGGVRGGLGGSLFLVECHNQRVGPCPECDLDYEVRLGKALRAAIATGAVRSAHDCSEGGLGVTLAECCMTAPEGLGQRVGAEVSLPVAKGQRPDDALFNEASGRVVLSCDPALAASLIRVFAEHQIPCEQIGLTGGDALRVTCGDARCELSVDRLAEVFYGTLPGLMNAQG
jgi:phosphoribosylformylglycinamidine synthase